MHVLDEGTSAHIRITSYNVCYTKLLRSFATIVHPEAIVGDTGDYCTEGSFTKQNIGVWPVDPSYSSQTSAIYFVSATGTGAGKTYEDSLSWSTLESLNLNDARLYLISDIDVSTELTLPDACNFSVRITSYNVCYTKLLRSVLPSDLPI